ncbi:hypothetical protein [Glycomyces buryatensis]|uniref:Uncharacterized protein n=1 Tax=Glycomyces buryatensis TaxID=2570927 RepID=A0A4V4HRM7_9ACTN|nr:hypothetical protein [Glycomyces buryatensis]THV38476.1 hypothetical protein FAB82_18695 [Glycomyces buryatensis]
MTPEHLRDAAAVAAIFGFFAMAWFGWAQEAPPCRWVKWLAAGSILSILTLIGGGLLMWQHWSDGTVFDDQVGTRFGIVVGIEFASAGIGSAVLAVRKRAQLISAWIAFVVGVHFFPVAVVLEIPALHLVAALVTAASVASVFIARAKQLTISAVVGASTGTVLLASALLSLLDAFLR